MHANITNIVKDFRNANDITGLDVLHMISCQSLDQSSVSFLQYQFKKLWSECIAKFFRK